MLKEMKKSNEELSKSLKETNDDFNMKNQEHKLEKDILCNQIQEIQKERDYFKSLVDQIRRIIPNKDDNEMIKAIENDCQFSNEVYSIFKGNNSNKIIKYVRNDVSLSYNIRTFFSSGDDPSIFEQIQTDHKMIPKMNNLEKDMNILQNKLKQYENYIKQLEENAKENEKNINQMKEKNLRLLQENNKLKEEKSQRTMTIAEFNKASFQDQKSFFDVLAKMKCQTKLNIFQIICLKTKITPTHA